MQWISFSIFRPKHLRNYIEVKQNILKKDQADYEEGQAIRSS